MSTPENTTRVFPPEIISQILSRLPAKSLCRFKSVSKPWLKLISNPKFAKLHLTHIQKQSLLIASKTLHSIPNISDLSLSNSITPKELKNYPHKNTHNDTIQIFGSCNGLVCILPQSYSETEQEPTMDFFVFNPTTGESKKIPEIDVPCPPNCSKYVPDIYGFGYSEAIDEYKFVKVEYGVLVYVYSFKTGSWNRVGDFPYNLPYNEPGTPLNGAVHWVQSHGGKGLNDSIMSRIMSLDIQIFNIEAPGTFVLPLGLPPATGDDYSCVVAAFDLATETFTDLPMPDPKADFRRYAVGVLGGHLCVMHHYDRMHNEFWVMKEYGVGESWARVFINTPYCVMRPLCYCGGQNGKKAVVVLEQKRVVVVDVEGGSCRDVVVHGGVPKGFDSVVYVESLVSPNRI